MSHDTYSDDEIAQVLSDARVFAFVGTSANTSRPSYFAMKYLLGKGYATFLSQRRIKKAVVGMDNRLTSEVYKKAFIKGLRDCGINVIDFGLGLSQIMYFAQYHFKLKGGAMVTASHNDNGWTGLKLAKGFSKTFEPDDIIYYKKLVYSGTFLKGQGGYESIEGFKDVYIKDIVGRVKPSMGKKKLKVVFSGGNG